MDTNASGAPDMQPAGEEENSRFDQVVVRYSRWLVRHRWWVVLASLIGVGALAAGVTRLHFDTDFRAYFGPGNPQLQAFDESQKVYNKSDAILFAFLPKEGSGNPDVFNAEVLGAVREFTRE